MKITIRPKRPRRDYECFNCETELSVRTVMRRCPFCNSEKSFYEMD